MACNWVNGEVVMARKQDWLDHGLTVVTDEGAQALTIDRLTGRLGVTKGSFYHHFAGMAGYQTALLGHFERVCADRYIEALEAAPDEPTVMLDRLLDMVLAGKEQALETAMRAWAHRDCQVAEVLSRVDHTRVAYMEGLWLRRGRDKNEARHAAQLLYVMVIGAGHMLPPLSKEDLRAAYRLVMDRI
jgi:AcrR family transcriptional regulator